MYTLYFNNIQLNSKEDNLYSAFVYDIYFRLEKELDPHTAYFICQVAYQFCLNFKLTECDVRYDINTLETKISKL